MGVLILDFEKQIIFTKYTYIIKIYLHEEKLTFPTIIDIITTLKQLFYTYLFIK